MKTIHISHIALFAITALLLGGCNVKMKVKESGRFDSAPIAKEVVAYAVAKQFRDSHGDRFVKVGEVRFDVSLDIYHVEVFYLEGSSEQGYKEKRYVMELNRFYDASRQSLVLYLGRFPTELFGDKARPFPSFTVTIDNMMNMKTDDASVKTE